MRKCQYISLEKSYLFTPGNYYYYEIIKYKNNNTKYKIPFPYHVYDICDRSKLISTFSENYFNEIFLDLGKERIEKLKKLNKKI